MVMTISTYEFDVRGSRPRPWGIPKDTNEWREFLAERIRKFQVRTIPKNSLVECQVKIDFFITIKYLFVSDLDNLAKPVIDTIFLPKNPQVKNRELTGVVFKDDDAYINVLELRKICVDSEEDEGVVINILYRLKQDS